VLILERAAFVFLERLLERHITEKRMYLLERGGSIF